MYLLTYMTRVKQPSTCDSCGGTIGAEATDAYTFELQKNDGIRGQFTKSVKGDMCKKCFMEMKDNGFLPNWQIIRKVGDKWIKVED